MSKKQQHTPASTVFPLLSRPLGPLFAGSTAALQKARAIRKRMVNLVLADAAASISPGIDDAVSGGYIRILTMLRTQFLAEWWLQFAEVTDPDAATMAASAAILHIPQIPPQVVGTLPTNEAAASELELETIQDFRANVERDRREHGSGAYPAWVASDPL